MNSKVCTHTAQVRFPPKYFFQIQSLQLRRSDYRLTHYLLSYTKLSIWLTVKSNFLIKHYMQYFSRNDHERLRIVLFRKTRTNGDKCTITVTKSMVTVTYQQRHYCFRKTLVSLLLCLLCLVRNKLMSVLSCDLTGYEANMRHSHV